jgi:hypothetical protein
VLREALGRTGTSAGGRIRFDVDTRGEAEQIPGSPEQNRRVQVFLPLTAPPPQPPTQLPPIVPVQFPTPRPKGPSRPPRPRPPAPRPRPAPRAPTFSRATKIRPYIDLVREAEKRLIAAKFKDVDDRIQILSGIYYGTDWSRDFATERSQARNLGFQVYTARSGPGPDPRPTLGASLFNALRDSQDVLVDARIGEVDMGHVIIGLNARASVLARTLTIPTQGGTGLENATWVGDLGGATGRLARDRVRAPKTPASKYFTGRRGRDYGADSNLEGDVGAYNAAAGSSPSTLQPLTVASGALIADALGDYFLSPTALAPRARQFLEMLGGTFSGARLTNRSSVESGMADRFKDFGLWYVGFRYGLSAATSAASGLPSAAAQVAQLFVDWLLAR